MKIKHAKLSQPFGRSQRLVTIYAELAGPKEFLTITVAVPNHGKDRDVCECGIARAKDFARHFSVEPLEYFPLPH